MSEKQEQLKILKEILGSCHRSGNEHLFFCPQSNCDSQKRKLSINLNKGFFHCWVCEWSGRSLYRIIKRYGSDSHKFKWKSYENFVDLSSFEHIFSTDKTFDINQKIQLPNDFISLTPKDMWQGRSRPVQYLKDRGLTYLDVLNWRLGYSPSHPRFGERIIVPSFGLSGHINYFIGRTYSENWIKYQNAEASKNIIFNHFTFIFFIYVIIRISFIKLLNIFLWDKFGLNLSSNGII